MKIRLRKFWLTFALIALVGQNVAYAYTACAPESMGKPVQTADCHDATSAVDHQPSEGADSDCQHGCDSLCSGFVASTATPSVFRGVQTDAFMKNLDSAPTKGLARNLFRPPIFG